MRVARYGSLLDLPSLVFPAHISLRRPHNLNAWNKLAVADPGEGRGGPSCPPPQFLDQTEARRAEKLFLETPPPLSQGLDPGLACESVTMLYVWFVVET